MAELELFPRYLLFLRQQPATRTQQSNVWVNMGMMSLRLFPHHWPRGNVPSPSTPLKRVLAYTGCFSRTQTVKEIHEYLSQRLRMKEEDMRLWLYNSEDRKTHQHFFLHRTTLLFLMMRITLRNKDMSWPEEMSFIANSSKIDRHKVPTEKGATGLSNLGNTCFMNSSIQCVSNTQPLTQYFISGRHLYELNRTNPIGMKGHMAKCYGDLIQELWSGTQKNIAPLKLRWTIAKYAPRFNGFQQQDSQELLAFLLDGLHEDLNRVHDKPYVELKDSDGRPDWEVAAELRSQVKCKTCGHISVRFDPFNFLSLPLPMDSYMHIEIIVTKLDGTTPVRYGLRLNMDEKYSDLKKHLSELCALKPDQILLAEVHSSNIKSTNGMINCLMNGDLPRSTLIPNGMPNTVVPCRVENGMMMNGHVTSPSDSPFIGYIIAVHRKMMRAEMYFLSSQKNRPSLFGMPLIVPCTVHTRKKDLFCYGCKIDCTEERALMGNANLAVDWDPTALHLRYQTSQERIAEEHRSVEQSQRAQAEPINLDSCLRAFTSEEELGEDEMYYCSKCRTHCLATKKLDLWRLPPILRFQFVNGRWIKSQKIVKFPRESFDPSAFLMPRDPSCWPPKLLTPQADDPTELLIVPEESQRAEQRGGTVAGEGDVLLTRSPSSLNASGILNNVRGKNLSPTSSPRTTGRSKGRLRLPQLCKNKLSSSKENLDASRENGTQPDPKATLDSLGREQQQNLGDGSGEPVAAQDNEGQLTNGYLCKLNSPSNHSLNGPLEACREEELADDQRGEICINPIYNLYAISCHSGIMGGGHYVTYAKNPNDKWYCYNDSSCKELHTDEIDTDSAYILFYEQQGVDYAQFLPKIEGKNMADTSSMDEDFESDYKKYCVLQ
ncbi:hypothetical protein Chor_005860 [Crotalus horridus]